jgi:hypothetical protein
VPEDGARGIARESAYDFPIVIAAMPVTTAQRGTALGVVIFLSVVALVIAPFAHIQAARVDNFHPGPADSSERCRSCCGEPLIYPVLDTAACLPLGAL